ncbi:MMPL family transporter [Glycomyces harbinensis]|uniref:Putative drug exporter of the RND superfamily n=1 Tax=Glycomyces harbinensis TaxID=58114 RepID=A0A1G6UDK0_9ACTN|nr:MMPL family transporter [Glycomyces harbinensis]SDD39329.1 putative drug exporter of the RND superfamily [Glycomyces harbinensis]
MAELLFRIGRLAARRAKTVIAAWVLVLAAAGAAYALWGGTLTTAITIPDIPTAEVTDRLAEEFPEAAGGSGTIVFQAEDGAFSAEQQEAIGKALTEVADVEGVEGVMDPFTTEAERSTQAEAMTSGLSQIEAGLDELDAGQAELDAARQGAEAAGADGEALAELDAQQAALDQGRAELEAQRTQLEQGAALMATAAEIRTVSEDGTAAIASVQFSEESMSLSDETKAGLTGVFEDDPIEGVQVDYSTEIAGGVPEVFGVGEAIGLVVAAVVLIVMLGTLIGAGLPILNALVGVGVGAMAAMSLSGVVEMTSVTPILGIMLGLAVGIDYSLFIINRHRRQLKDGYDLEESIPLANGTSGNAVVFAGATVVIALLALNVTGVPFLGLMGTVGAMCIVVAVLVAVTLTPALLGLVGKRVLGRKDRAAVAGDGPVKKPKAPRQFTVLGAIGIVVASVVGLLILAIPALDLRLNLPDGSTEAHDSTQYQAYEAVSESFGAGVNGPLLVVADLPPSADEAELTAHQIAVAQALFEQDDVVAVAPIGANEDGSVAAFQVVPEDGPTSESTEELVHSLRDLSPIDGVYDIGVAGSASGNIDVSDKLADALPLYLVVVVGLSLIILVLVFRSIYVPVIATLGFILSYFAALGGVVAIYQWGWLAGVFGVESPGPILNFLPTLLVGILFGLAMDYMLFLGSGMREAYAHGAPARLAVVQGLQAGRAVVTAAAIIMIAVFGGFMFSHSAMIRPIGFAMAFGVLVDAFVVRMLLIPALMHLAGDKAWWLPKWLDRILPDVDVEGASLERRHPHVEHGAEPVAADKG